jgi:hypothetical protein
MRSLETWSDRGQENETVKVRERESRRKKKEIETERDLIQNE